MRSLAELGALSSPVVRDAFLEIPREVFVPEVVASRGLDAAYGPVEALVVKTDASGVAISSSSAPSIMAPMLEHLELDPGHRVLEIGAGTGYNAALLKTIVGQKGRVTSVDIDSDLVARARRALRECSIHATVRRGDGAKGWAEGAPYDRIIVTASSAELPRAWFDQLVAGGLLQVPFRLRTSTFGPQIVVTFEKTPTGFITRSLVPGGFMTLRPEAGADALSYPTFSLQASTTKPWVALTIMGASLSRLSDPSRRRLLTVMASKPRTSVVASGRKERVGGLPLFAALALPPPRSIESMNSWWVVGLIDRSGAGMALLEPRGLVFNPKGRGTVRLHARGSLAPEREVRAIVRSWRDAGSPAWSDLRITASYDGHRRGWRSEKRGDATISFAWFHADP